MKKRPDCGFGGKAGTRLEGEASSNEAGLIPGICSMSTWAVGSDSGFKGCMSSSSVLCAVHLFGLA